MEAGHGRPGRTLLCCLSLTMPILYLPLVLLGQKNRASAENSNASPVCRLILVHTSLYSPDEKLLPSRPRQRASGQTLASITRVRCRPALVLVQSLPQDLRPQRAPASLIFTAHYLGADIDEKLYGANSRHHTAIGAPPFELSDSTIANVLC